MTYDPHRHHRRSIRLKDYDYSWAGLYFVTIVTHRRECILGRVMDGVMGLNEAGQIVESAWETLPDHCPDIEPDAFTIMPNHVHAIVLIRGAAGAIRESPPYQLAMKKIRTALWREL